MLAHPCCEHSTRVVYIFLFDRLTGRIFPTSPFWTLESKPGGQACEPFFSRPACSPWPHVGSSAVNFLKQSIMQAAALLTFCIFQLFEVDPRMGPRGRGDRS